MYFANPWGLLGLLALPAILAIHLYHRRYPPLYVAGAHLWSLETRIEAPGRKRERLPLTSTLLLELLAALLLSLVLSEPHIGELEQVTHLVAVLDNSASMASHATGKPSARDLAVQALTERVAALPRGSVLTVITTGRRPVMLAGPAVPWEEAEKKLAAWQPNQPRHQFPPAWDLARQLVVEGGNLLFLTDHVPNENELPSPLEVIAVGSPLQNASLNAARWSFDPLQAKGTIYIRVKSHSPTPLSVTVRGTTAGKTVFERPLQLTSQGVQSFEVSVPGGLKVVTVTLECPQDGLELDNQLVLVEPTLRSVTIRETLPQGPARTILRRTVQALPDVNLGNDGAQLQVQPASSPPPTEGTAWTLSLGPLDPAESAREKAKDLLGPYVLEKRHPLLDGISLGGIVWGGVQPFKGGYFPLITAGANPLYLQLRGTHSPAYLLNLDLEKTNLTESPDWPILLSNLIELRRQNLPGLQRWNYRIGEEIQFRLFEGEDPAPNEALQLVFGETKRPLTRGPTVQLPLLEQPGLYTVQEGEQPFGQFAVNFFDAEESNLTGLQTRVRLPTTPPTPTTIELDNPYSWAILIGTILILAAILADWLVLRPRRLT